MNTFTKQHRASEALTTLASPKARAIRMLILAIAAIATALALSGCAPAFAETTAAANPTHAQPETDGQSPDRDFTASAFHTSLIADTYEESSTLGTLEIYDMDYLYKVYGDEEAEVGAQELIAAIAGNGGIPPRFRNMLFDYFRSVEELYPNADLRPFRDNLKTLRIVEIPQSEMGTITSASSLGCYDRRTNVMYLPDDYAYGYYSWQRQVFFHELSHCLRTRQFEQDGTTVKIQVEGSNFTNNMTAEALNSLFAVSLLGYEEDNITYQLQSNLVQAMIESLDDYDLSDYANHSVSYFARKLDEHNGGNRAVEMLELMQRQYEEYHGVGRGEIDGETTETFEVNGSKYAALFDYVAETYYRTHIAPGMTDAEQRVVADDLVAMISRNTPEEFNVDYERFYDFLDAYDSSTQGAHSLNPSTGCRTSVDAMVSVM